jgi:hypothetical protein
MFKIVQTKQGFKVKRPNKQPNADGELQIERFLVEMSIKYLKRKKIFDLKGDTKKYRVPDFYLPEYDLSIEYLGSWDAAKKDYFGKKEIQRFMKKVYVYQVNELNCVFIYPKDLATAPTIIMKAINRKSKANPYQDIKIPWLEYEKIEKPLPSDFITKPLNWQLDWLNPKKIEEPWPSDFVREIKKKVKKKIKVEIRKPRIEIREPEIVPDYSLEEPNEKVSRGIGEFIISAIGILLILLIIGSIILVIFFFLSFGM